MAVMQRQESFNRFYQEFIIGGAPRCVEGGPDEDGLCVYRNKEGHGCAIGIQPEFQEIYNSAMEENSIKDLYSTCSEVQAIIDEADLEFFFGLQDLHDNELENVWSFDDKVKDFALLYGVNIPVHEVEE